MLKNSPQVSNKRSQIKIYILDNLTCLAFFAEKLFEKLTPGQLVKKL